MSKAPSMPPADKPDLPLLRTDFGFRFGQAEVSALAQHRGEAYVGIVTPRERVQIRITPSGLVRVHKEKAR